LVRFEQTVNDSLRFQDKDGGSTTAIPSNVVSFVNSKEKGLGEELPGGNLLLVKRREDGFGVEEVARLKVSHQNPDEIVYWTIGSIPGIQGFRKQVSFHLDKNKCIITETIEITIENNNGKEEEALDVVVEDFLYRWKRWDISSSPPHKKDKEHDRKAYWKLQLEPNSKQKIQYTVTYSGFPQGALVV